MRKIYGFHNGSIAVAWIGESAPMPNGWVADKNSLVVDEKPVARDTVDTPKKRRGRKKGHI